MTAERYMSAHERATRHSEAALMGFLQKTMRLDDEERATLEELLHDYVKDQSEYYASQALDREFNRGDFRY